MFLEILCFLAAKKYFGAQPNYIATFVAQDCFENKMMKNFVFGNEFSS